MGLHHNYMNHSLTMHSTNYMLAKFEITRNFVAPILDLTIRNVLQPVIIVAPGHIY